jgi:hypothetical protein
VRVGGLSVLARSEASDLALEVGGSVRSFVSEAEAPDLSLRVARRQLAPEAPGMLVFDSGATWRLYEHAGAQIYRFFDPRLGSIPYREARLAPDGATGEVLLNPDQYPAGEPADALQFPLDELLFLRLLAQRGGVELHACGVLAPSGRGYVFAGQSGDGKTTTARLWQQVPGATVLSDDRIIVRPEAAGGFTMHGTPWHGEAELSASASAPLAAVFLLARGERNEVAPLSPCAAVASLLARAVTAFCDAHAVSALLDTLAPLVREVPCATFRFVPGEDAVQAVLETAP